MQARRVAGIVAPAVQMQRRGREDGRKKGACRLAGSSRAQTERSFRHKEISPEHFGEYTAKGVERHRSDVRHHAQLLYRWQHQVLSALETRAENSQLLHLVDQRSALHAKFDGCAFRAADYPTDGF
jgi:hypothetical protein